MLRILSRFEVEVVRMSCVLHEKLVCGVCLQAAAHGRRFCHILYLEGSVKRVDTWAIFYNFLLFPVAGIFIFTVYSRLSGLMEGLHG
jgi:hypothetical protein